MVTGFDGRVVIKIIPPIIPNGDLQEPFKDRVSRKESVYTTLPELQGLGIQYLFCVTTLENQERGNEAFVFAFEYIAQSFEDVPKEIDAGGYPHLQNISNYGRLAREAVETILLAHSRGIIHGDMEDCHALFDGSRVVLIDWSNHDYTDEKVISAFKYGDIRKTLLCFLRSSKYAITLQNWIRENAPEIAQLLGDKGGNSQMC